MRGWQAGSPFRGLRVQILLWTILPAIILVIAFLLTGVRQHQHTMRAMVAERDAGLAQALAGNTAALLDCYTGSLRTLAAAVAPQGDNPQALEAALAVTQRHLPELGLAVVAANGEIRAGPRPLPAWATELARHLATTPSTAGVPLIATSADGNTITWIVPLG
ncbi:MAG: hypothetical protein ACUVWR_14215, partial [Anaerolineae bacterium]